MRMNLRRGIYNVFFGILSQVITLGVSIVIPRLVLINLGSEINGFLQSISSIFTYLTLLEGGVGKATRQALYKPLAENDKKEINAILSATNKFYVRTGYIYILAVTVFAILYALFIKTCIPKYTVIIVILLTGGSSVLSYFVQGKYRILMEAEGKTYILTNVSTVSSVVFSISKILLLVYGFGVIAIQSVFFFFAVLQMLFIVIYIKRFYKWVNCKVEPDYNAISQSKYVLLHQITGMIFDNTDVILLTATLGLKSVSVYTMYATFYNIVKTAVNTISYSYSYLLGQVYNSNKELFIRLHDVYELYNMAITFGLICILNTFILPFMRLYTLGVTDINYIDPYIPLLFTSLYLLSNGRASSGLVIEFAQHFEQTKWRAVLEASINIIVSLIAINFCGIYGALIGTIVALIYRANDMIIYASKLMNRSPWITYRRWIINIAIFFVISYVINNFLPVLDTYPLMFLYAVVSGGIIMTVFIGLNSLLEIRTARYALTYIKKRFSK